MKQTSSHYADSRTESPHTICWWKKGAAHLRCSGDILRNLSSVSARAGFTLALKQQCELQQFVGLFWLCNMLVCIWPHGTRVLRQDSAQKASEHKLEIP